MKIKSRKEFMNYVTIFSELKGVKFVELIKPDIYVNGSEYGENCVEAPIVKKYGGRVHIIKIRKGISSSGLIKKILDLYSK